MALPELAWALGHIPPRTLDLLEIAAYVYAADRYSSRGDPAAVEYDAWARRFRFRIRVRDHTFWKSPHVRNALGAALEFLTGDAAYEFAFEPGHSTPPATLFDSTERVEVPKAPTAVALFSGGLDSLAGALEVLSGTQSGLVLVSHQSRPSTKQTQGQLVDALKRHFGSRCAHYRFECNLTGVRAQEETQRSRFFLYAAVAFAVAQAHGQRRFSVFENGVTSMNLSRRPDLLDARASRTTHPKGLRGVAAFLSEVARAEVLIDTPYFERTKRDVVEQLLKGPHPELISSSVSCSRTFRLLTNTTHCGECFQCIDRRLAVYAAGAEAHDHPGLYATDVISGTFSGREAKTTAVDYLRQAVELSEMGIDRFHDRFLSELVDIVPSMDARAGEADALARLWRLLQRHGEGVLEGLRRMRDLHDNLRAKHDGPSLLSVINEREYLHGPVRRLVDELRRVLEDAVPKMFRRSPPTDEPDLNQKVSALLSSHCARIRSEHPTASFACARVIPDHEVHGASVLIESKFIRANTPPSKATDGIAADLTKYPEGAHILFLVLDCEGRIPDDRAFTSDIEAKGRCTVVIVR